MYCIARSIALGVRDLLLLPEEDVSAEDLELLFLRVRPVETTEWVECDGIVAGRGLPFCRGRCHQIERCWEVAARSEAEYTALYRLGLGCTGLKLNWWCWWWGPRTCLHVGRATAMIVVELTRRLRWELVGHMWRPRRIDSGYCFLSRLVLHHPVGARVGFCLGLRDRHDGRCEDIGWGFISGTC